MRITQETALNGDMARRFWALYDEAFAPLRTLSPCRQWLTREEFLHEMADERIIKFVLWDGDEAVGLLLVASDLEAVPWISADYFAARYPRQYAAGRIYYSGALLTVPHERRLGNANRLILACSEFIAEQQGVFAFDCAGVNAEFLPAAIRAVADEVHPYRWHELDAQHYYAIEAIPERRPSRRFVREGTPVAAGA